MSSMMVAMVTTMEGARTVSFSPLPDPSYFTSMTSTYYIPHDVE